MLKLGLGPHLPATGPGLSLAAARDGISGPGTPQQGGLGERITELLRLEEVTEGLGSGGSGCVNWRVTGRVRGLVFLSEQGSDVHV